jgi:hypothetical protein
MEEKNSPALEFIHELSILLPILDRAATSMSKGTSGKPDIQQLEYAANTILEVTETIGTHLTLLNLELNYEFYTHQQPQRINIYDAFWKCAKFLRGRIKGKNLKINLEKNINGLVPEIECLKIISTIPYIIFVIIVLNMR